MIYIGQKVTIADTDGNTDQGRVVSSLKEGEVVIRRDHKLILDGGVEHYLRSRSNTEEAFYYDPSEGWWNKGRTSQITSF